MGFVPIAPDGSALTLVLPSCPGRLAASVLGRQQLLLLPAVTSEIAVAVG